MNTSIIEDVLEEALPGLIKSALEDVYLDSDVISTALSTELKAAVKESNIKGVFTKALKTLLNDEKFVNKAAKQLLLKNAGGFF